MKTALVPANTPFPRFFPDAWPYPRGQYACGMGEMAAEGQTTTLRRLLTISRAPGYCRLMPGVMAPNKAATLSEAHALISWLSLTPSFVQTFFQSRQPLRGTGGFLDPGGLFQRRGD